MKSKKKPSKGLGDTIEKVTKFTGLKAAVESIFGEDCGCSERKEKLNKLFPFGAHMSAEDRDLYNKHLINWKKGGKVTASQQHLAIDIWIRSTNKKKKFSNCTSCVRKFFEDLEKLYENSCDND